MNTKIATTLEARHAAWILEWAIEACAKKIAEAETEVTRHHITAGVHSHAIYPNRYGLAVTRGERVKGLNEDLRQYYAIYDFLTAAKQRQLKTSAAEFADMMVAMFKEQQR